MIIKITNVKPEIPPVIKINESVFKIKE